MCTGTRPVPIQKVLTTLLAPLGPAKYVASAFYPSPIGSAHKFASSHLRRSDAARARHLRDTSFPLPADMAWRVGSQARIVRLKSRADLNGTPVTVVVWDGAKARWGVRCRPSGEVVKVKVENLENLDPQRKVIGNEPRVKEARGKAGGFILRTSAQPQNGARRTVRVDARSHVRDSVLVEHSSPSYELYPVIFRPKSTRGDESLFFYMPLPTGGFTGKRGHARAGVQTG